MTIRERSPHTEYVTNVVARYCDLASVRQHELLTPFLEVCLPLAEFGVARGSDLARFEFRGSADEAALACASPIRAEINIYGKKTAF